jgi:hypothetical protein
MTNSSALKIAPVMAFRMAPRAIELAGGPGGMNERFAARLRGFLRDRGDPFEVEQTQLFVAATARGRNAALVLQPLVSHWIKPSPIVTYQVFGWDADLPFWGTPDSAPPIHSDYWRRFTELCRLVADWPEVTSVHCTT